MNKAIIAFGVLVSIFTSCQQREVINRIEEVAALGTYDPTNFKANTIDERELIYNFKSLLSKISTAKPGSVTDSLNGAKCQTIYYKDLFGFASAGNISMYSLANENFKAIAFDSTSGYMKKAAIASVNSHFNPNDAINANSVGGRYTQYSGYLFDKHGVDIEELVQKSFFGSLYDKVFLDLLTPEKISLSNLDKALALYGAPTSFPNGLKIKVGRDSITDVYVANYAARRDNAYGAGRAGYYTIIKTEFIQLQQLLKDDPSNKSKITEHITMLRKNWELAMMATVINYLQASKVGLPKSSDADVSKALHSLGECLGLIVSFKSVKAEKVISEAQVAQLLDKLYFSAPNDNDNPLKLRANTSELGRLNDAISMIQQIYGFSDLQVNTLFLQNDVSSRNIGMRLE